MQGMINKGELIAYRLGYGWNRCERDQKPDETVTVISYARAPFEPAKALDYHSVKHLVITRFYQDIDQRLIHQIIPTDWPIPTHEDEWLQTSDYWEEKDEPTKVSRCCEYAKFLASLPKPVVLKEWMEPAGVPIVYPKGITGKGSA